MTEEVPDYVIRPAVSTVHTNLHKTNQFAGLTESQIQNFNEWNANIANRDALAAGAVPVSGTSVTGAVRTNSVGIAPATSVAIDTTNMLVVQNFSSADTIVNDPSDRWSWDGTDGNLTLGCALVDCDGTQDDLVSNEIPVIVGENIEVSCQVKWENITYTGTGEIILGVEKYRKGRDPVTGGVTYLDLGGVDVAGIASPSPDGGWGTDGDLAGTYVVESGVDQLRFRFRAATDIIDGHIKWDEAVFLKLDLIDDAAVPGVGQTVDDIVRELFGSEGDSFTHNEAAVALGNTSAAITSINARLSATEAEVSTGSIAGDDFLWSGEMTTDADWNGFYTLPIPENGQYVADGADAVWTIVGATPSSTTQECLFDWVGTDAVSVTDYQLIQLVLSSSPTTSLTFKSYIYLLGRVQAGWSSYVLARFGSDSTYSFGYVNGGSYVVMDSGTCRKPGRGALLSMYCGDKATTAPRHFKLRVDTVTISEFDEVGTGSPLGASNRKWGWGGKAIGGVSLVIFAGQGQLPKVNQWLGYDQ